MPPEVNELDQWINERKKTATPETNDLDKWIESKKPTQTQELPPAPIERPVRDRILAAAATGLKATIPGMVARKIGVNPLSGADVDTAIQKYPGASLAGSIIGGAPTYAGASLLGIPAPATFGAIGAAQEALAIKEKEAKQSLILPKLLPIQKVARVATAGAAGVATGAVFREADMAKNILTGMGKAGLGGGASKLTENIVKRFITKEPQNVPQDLLEAGEQALVLAAGHGITRIPALRSEVWKRAEEVAKTKWPRAKVGSYAEAKELLRKEGIEPETLSPAWIEAKNAQAVGKTTGLAKKHIKEVAEYAGVSIEQAKQWNQMQLNEAYYSWLYHQGRSTAVYQQAKSVYAERLAAEYVSKVGESTVYLDKQGKFTASEVPFKPGTLVKDIVGDQGLIKKAEVDPSTGILFYTINFGPKAPNAVLSEGSFEVIETPADKLIAAKKKIPPLDAVGKPVVGKVEEGKVKTNLPAATYTYTDLTPQDFRTNKGAVGDKFFPIKETDEEILAKVNPDLMKGLVAAKLPIHKGTDLHLTISSTGRTSELQTKLAELKYPVEKGLSKHVTYGASDVVFKDTLGNVIDWQKIDKKKQFTIRKALIHNKLKIGSYDKSGHLHIEPIFKQAPTVGPQRYKMIDARGNVVDLSKPEAVKAPDFPSVMYKGGLVKFVRDGAEELGIVKKEQEVKPEDNITIINISDGTESDIKAGEAIVIQTINIPENIEQLPIFQAKKIKPLQPPTLISRMIADGRIKPKELIKKVTSAIFRAEIGKGENALKIQDIARINRISISGILPDVRQSVLTDLIKNHVYDGSQPLEKWLNSKIFWLVKDHLIRLSVSPDFGQTKYTKEQLTRASKKSMAMLALKLSLQNKRTPTEEELAAAMGLTTEELRNLRTASRAGTAKSLEEYVIQEAGDSKGGRKMPVYNPEEQAFAGGEEIELYAGFPFPKEMRDMVDRRRADLKEYVKSDPVHMTTVEKVVDHWFGNTNSGYLNAKWDLEDIVKVVPKLERREIISRSMEDESLVKLLSEDENVVRLFLKSEYQKLWRWAHDNAIMEAFRENYITHIVKDNIEKVRKVMYPVGGKLGVKFRFALKRGFPTFAEMEAAGLTPELDCATLFCIYKQQLTRTIANKQLITALKDMYNEEGYPLIVRMDKAKNIPLHYAVVKETAFSKYMFVGKAGALPMLIKTNVVADPRLAKLLNELTSPLIPYNRYMRAMTHARGIVKRVIMYNALIHTWNIGRQAVSQYNFNVFAIYRAYAKGYKLWKNHDEQIDHMVKQGLNLQGLWTVFGELYERLQNNPAIIHTWKDIGKTLVAGKPVHALSAAVVKIKEYNDKLLWEGVVKFTQIALWDNTVTRNLRYNTKLTLDQAEQLAAKQINDMTGTLPSHLFSGMEKEVLNWTLFARNWTVSNLRYVTGAIGAGTGGPVKLRFLQHRGLDPEQLKANQKFWINYLIRSLVYMLIHSQLLQWMFQKMHNQKLTFLWENEATHKIDIDMGIRDKNGRPVYLVSMLFRDIRDQISWITDAPRTALNKMEPLLKTSAEAMVNIQFWNRKPVTEKEGIAGALERFAHIVVGTSPWRSVEILPIIGSEEQEGKIVLSEERWIRVLGGWTRHGLVYPSQIFNLMSNRDKTMFIMSLSKEERADFQAKLDKGLIDGTIAHIFFRFRKDRELAKKELNTKVGLLLQKNKIRDAVAEMKKFGLSVPSIYNRLIEYSQRRINR